VSGEKRRDFRIYLTAALLCTTFALVVLQVKGRMDATEEARRKTAVIHKAALNAVQKKVLELKKTLDAWSPGDDNPPDFDKVMTGQGLTDPVLQEVVMKE